MYAGTIIDRYSRKKIFLITNFICGTIIASVSAYGFYNQSTSEYLVILVFLITIFNYNVHYPNLYAFGQEITEKKITESLILTLRYKDNRRVCLLELLPPYY